MPRGVGDFFFKKKVPINDLFFFFIKIAYRLYLYLIFLARDLKTISSDLILMRYWKV